ncbi:MAG: DUF262 domain-containing protein, partial [Pseudomonadota bacterium]
MPASITSTMLPLEAFFACGTFRPASVQRTFKWGASDVDQLISDIMQALKASEEMSAEEMLADLILPPTSATPNDPIPTFRVDPLDADDGGDDDLLPDGDDGGLLSDSADDGADAGPGTGAGTRRRPKTFFLGAVIVKPTQHAAHEAIAHEIYDGLQRITALTILAALLRDMVENTDLRARLAACVATADGTARLSHRGSSEVLRDLVQPDGEASRMRRREPPAIETEARVFDVLRTVRLAVTSRSVANREALARFMLEHVQVAVIATTDDQIARHAFIATNLYGIRLSRDEIFKGELVALAADEAEAQETLATWENIRERVEGGRDLLVTDQGRRTMRTAHQMEAFLLAVDVLERRAEQSADALGDLIAHLRNKRDVQPISAWMTWLERVSEAWAFIEKGINEPELDLPVQRELYKLGCFKWQEWRPLVLFWTMAFLRNRQAKTAVRRFRFVHARCAAITILELDAASRAFRFRRALSGATRGVVFSVDTRDDLPLNFKPRFRNRIKERLLLPIEDHEVRRSIVLWYDLVRRTALPGDPAAYWARASIEHVLPRKPEPGSQWLDDFPDATERFFACTSLGNLGVIDQRLQSRAANGDWTGAKGKRALFLKERQHVAYNSMSD